MKKELDFEDKNFLYLIDSMKIFAENYAKSSSTSFCIDEDITEAVIIGLAKNKMESGSPLCPCRCYSDKKEEALFSYWNCPCVPMRERKECHCMLFLTPENSYSSGLNKINLNLTKYICKNKKE
jgi:ferredoxin-thioredoxin reductase catalytic chain